MHGRAHFPVRRRVRCRHDRRFQTRYECRSSDRDGSISILRSFSTSDVRTPDWTHRSIAKQVKEASIVEHVWRRAKDD